MWYEEVAQTVFKFYQTLPKTGRPNWKTEWTNLSAFLSYNGTDLRVLACATGTRCIGKSHLNKDGHRLHDSHAEILVRRAFQRLVLEEILCLHSGKCSTLLESDTDCRVKLKSGLNIIFFTSQTPCGDASIFPRPAGDIHPERKRRQEAKISHEQSKRLKTIPITEEREKNPEKTSKVDAQNSNSDVINIKTPKNGQRTMIPDSDKNTESDVREHNATQDIQLSKTEYKTVFVDGDSDLYRTGAKCVVGMAQDSLESGNGYHVTGVLRTKPGRGDRTISLSCSDKIARWNILGCQGCLPMLFLSEPIRIDHIVISGCSYDMQAMERALFRRMEHISDVIPHPYKLNKPQIHYFGDKFTDSKSSAEARNPNSKIIPCATSIVTYIRDGGDGPNIEVSVDGYKQGVTKKALHTPKARLSICRSEMFKQAHDVFSSLPSETKTSLFDCQQLPTTYQACKEKTGYSALWKTLTDTEPFKYWPQKERSFSEFTMEAG